jgi:hypothetical protein
VAVASLIFEPIREAVAAGRYRVTHHGAASMRDDWILLAEVIGVTQTGRVIEDYPAAVPYPGCLVFGRTSSGNALHCVWSYSAADRAAILVTCYWPDPGRWINFEVRR